MVILFQCMVLFLDQINFCDSDVHCFYLLNIPLTRADAMTLGRVQKNSSFAAIEQYQYSWYKDS